MKQTGSNGRTFQGKDVPMHGSRQSNTFVPVLVAASIAAVGIAGSLYMATGVSDSGGHGAGMITTAVVANAGAMLTPTRVNDR